MSAAAWQESVNPVLLERLLRPLVAPGVISLALVRRILRGVERFSARLPLLAHLARRRGQAGGLRVNEVPIVHGRWVAPPRPEPSAPALAPAATREVIVVKAAPAARPDEGAGRLGAPAAPAAAGAALVHVTVRAAAATSAGAPQAGEERARREASAAPAAPAAPRAAFDPDRAPSPVAGGATATLPVVTSAPLPVALAARPAVGAPLPLVLAAPAQRAAAPLPAAPRAASAAVAPSSRPVVAPRSPARSLAPLEARAQLPHAPLSRGAQAPLRPARSVDDALVALGDGPRRPVVQPSPAQRGAAAAAAAPGPLPHGAPPLPRVAPAPEPAAPRPDHLPHVRVAGGRAEAQAAAAPDSAAPVAAPGAPMLPPRAVPVAAATPVVPGSVSPLAAAPGPVAGALGMDLETLVDKVQRKLVRRMSAERERRGGFR
ncbi:hypothetical protein WME90_39460 [Sorangium sp. So ce375]|uniref:hypothetical protein n=1 Tax=Sorangium sp. So ce375 TaxID=3133306 RepID=UPI003F5CB472